MTAMDSVKARIEELECIVKLQMQRLDELSAENERLRAEGGAHAALKDVYLNPSSSEGNKIKAAAASLPFERPKLMSERAPLDLTAEEVIPLADLVTQRRARQNAMQGQEIEVLPSGQVLVLKPGGNGDDSDH